MVIRRKLVKYLKVFVIILTTLYNYSLLFGVYTKKLEIKFSLQNANDFTFVSNISFLQRGATVSFNIKGIFTGTESFVSWIEGSDPNYVFLTVNPNNVYTYNGSRIENIGSVPNHSIVTKIRVIDNFVYILTGEKGAIYMLEFVRNEPMFTLDEGYVWDIFKIKNKYFVITGNPARVYEMQKNNLRKVFESYNDKHFLVALPDKDGVFIGSSGTGTVYYFDGVSVTPFISLKDSEITDIKKYGNDLIVSTYNITSAQSQQPSQQDSKASASSPQSVLRNTQGNVYRIDTKTKRVELLFSELGITSLEIVEDRIFSTTIDGKLIEYSIPEGSAKYSLNNKNFLKLFKFRDTMFISSANPSGLDVISLSQSEFYGVLETKEIEVGNVLSWGRIRYDASIPKDAKISFYIKGGNTQKEDDSWSSWVEVKENINLDRFQYIKLRVEMSSKGYKNLPILRSISILYTPRNSRPQISSFLVSYKDDNINFEWKASDPDNDKLSFDVLVRNFNETTWQKLNRNSISDTRFSVNKYLLGSGIFSFALVSSDAPSNPKGLELSTTNYVDNFVIDLVPPQLYRQTLKVNKSDKSVVIEFGVSDNQSLKEVLYSIDGVEWEYVLPNDGVVDGPFETFKIELPSKYADVVLIRIQDDFGNTTTERIQL